MPKCWGQHSSMSIKFYTALWMELMQGSAYQILILMVMLVILTPTVTSTRVYGAHLPLPLLEKFGAHLPLPLLENVADTDNYLD